MEAARYYVPLAFYGFLLAWGLRIRSAQMIVIAVFSIILFRTAAGRVSWVHTRYALPLFGIAVVAFVIEPLLAVRRRISAIIAMVIAVVFVEAGPNIVRAGPLIF